MSQEMYSRAAVLLDLLDRIGHSLGDSLEPQHVEDSLPFRLEAVVLQRTLSIGSPLRSQGELARLLWNLAIVLHKLGRNKEPCLVDEEALAIRRDCHRSRPDANLHLLAAQLHVYSIQLHCEERYLEAVEACEEAAMLRRSLYECDPSKHTEPLAKSLHNLAAFLTSAERLEDAKVIGEEAIMLRRILLEKEPGQHRSPRDYKNGINIDLRLLAAVISLAVIVNGPGSRHTFNLATVVGQILAGLYCERHPFTGVIFFSGLITSVLAYGLWGFAHNLTTVFIFSVAFAFTAGSFTSTWMPAATEIAASRPTSDVFMFLAATKGVSAIVGPLIAAALHPKKASSGHLTAGRGGWGGYGFTGITIFVGSAMAATAVMGVISEVVRQRFMTRTATH
ncbi:hypothetical protein DL93DRAFT_2165957 [Clavulina sp. PMI_390]|nr:hypothetical protein DL93DRAFT_2165957 [Clavulina sp. PMI_390]